MGDRRCRLRAHRGDEAVIKSWRDVIKVHPAADLFPMMAPDEVNREFRAARRGDHVQELHRAGEDANDRSRELAFPVHFDERMLERMQQTYLRGCDESAGG